MPLRLFVRIFGLPPAKPTREQALLWVRRFFLRLLSLLVVPYAVGVLLLPDWFRVLLAFGAACWAVGFFVANVDLWRERQRLRSQDGP